MRPEGDQGRSAKPAATALAGIHPVREALRAGRALERVLIARAVAQIDVRLRGGLASHLRRRRRRTHALRRRRGSRRDRFGRGPALHRPLLAPLDPGSTGIAFSSGAAINGSPLSGGYAGAKAAIRFLTAYAAAESERNKLDIRFTALLPQLTPATELGAAAVAAYAARQGADLPAFLQGMGPALTPEQVGTTVVAIGTDPGLGQVAYLVGAIPFGYLVARSRGVDILKQGSGNIGATNVGRVLGRGFGAAVFVLDFLKGALPVAVARAIAPPSSDLAA